MSFGIGFPPKEHVLSRKLVSFAMSQFVSEPSSVDVSSDEKSEWESLMNYSVFEEGLPKVRSVVASWVNRQFARSECYTAAMDVSGEQLILASGVSQGMQIALNSLIEVGTRDVVLIENPSFFVVTRIIKNSHALVCPVPTNLETGIDCEQLEELLNTRLADGRRVADRVAAMYVIPSHQNPCGFHYTLEQRRKLIQLAHRFQFAICADEVYSLLSFDESSRMPLLTGTEAQLFAEGTLRGTAKGNGRVISVCSMSKMIGGGFRVGWIHTWNARYFQEMSLYGVFSCSCTSAHFCSTLFRPFFGEVISKKKMKMLAPARRGMAAADSDDFVEEEEVVAPVLDSESTDGKMEVKSPESKSPETKSPETELLFDLPQELLAHLCRVRQSLCEKANWLMAAIDKYDTDKVCKYVKPSGGYFILLRTPVPAAAVATYAEAHSSELPVALSFVSGVRCSPRFNPICKDMQLFALTADAAELRQKKAFEHSIRLCFAILPDADAFDVGIQTLMAVIYKLHTADL